MSTLASPWGLMLIAFATSLFWRALGAALSGRIEADSALFDWCVCVTQALVGGLMVRAVLMPSTALALVPLTDRVAAAALGIVLFIACRRMVLPGVVVGVAALALLILWRDG